MFLSYYTNARAFYRAQKEAQPALYFIVHHFIYSVLIDIDNKVKLIIAFCRIKFGREEANLAFFKITTVLSFSR